MENRKAFFAEIGMFVLTIIWGFCFIATKISARYYTPAQMIFYRLLIAAVILSIVFFKDIIKIDKRGLTSGAGLGILLYLGFLTQTAAINYTTVAKNAFLTTLYIIFVPIIAAVVNKERVDKYSVIGCLLALLGTGILSLNLDLTINFGDILSIACAVFFSFHIYYQGVFVKETNPMALTAVQFITAAIFAFFVTLFAGELKLTVYNFEGLMGIAFLGVFGTCISLLLQAICQKYASPVKAVVIFSLEAVFASLFAAIIFRDSVTIRFLLGSAAIFSAVIISTTKLAFLRNTGKQKLLTKEEQ